jgi:predicted exporter
VNLTSINKLYIWLLQCALLALFLVFIVIEKPITFNTNLTSLFSVNHDNQWQSIQKKIDSKLNTSLIYLVGHQQQSEAIKATNQLVTQLDAITGITTVSAKLDNTPNQHSMINSYAGFEQQLLTPTYREHLVQEEKNVFDLQFQLLNQLGDSLVPNTINKDSTLAFANFLNRSPFPSNQLTMTADGYLTLNYQNISYVLVTMKTAEGAFDLNTAKNIVTQLDNLKKTKNVQYIRTGAIFYSFEASEQAQKEMQWLGGLSILATLLLIYLAYRRFITLVCTVFLIGISIVYGFLGLNLFFDEVNILSVVFAITLIGIAADYSFHSLTELQNILPTTINPLKNVSSSLVLSFLTTALGYLLLVVVPIVIFKQIAVFTIFGLLGALITVLLVFPYLHQKFNFQNSTIKNNSTKSNDENSVFLTINKKHQAMLKNWQGYIYLLITLLALSITALTQIPFSDNAKSFYQVPEQLFKNENTVKAMLGQKLDNQYLLLQADTQQALLENEEDAIVLLDEMQSNNVFTSYQAIASWLPSIKQQQLNNQLLLTSAEKNQFNDLQKMLGGNNINVKPIEQYLLPNLWFDSSIGKVFKHLWLQENGKYYSVIKFAGISDIDTLSLKLSVLKNSIFVDKLADTEAELATFRLVLALIFIAACLAGLTVFYCRYGFKRACYGVAVPASSFVIALALSAITQGDLTLFNLAAGLVILALGLDYSIFYAEHGFSTSITKTTLMSALSSIFVFAVLSFSSTPAIASFGKTVFLGIVITFLFCPIITKISRKRGKNASK